MAYSDYLLCIECEGKAVYDADWYNRVDPEDWAGQVEALCPSCAKHYELVARPKVMESGEGAG